MRKLTQQGALWAAMLMITSSSLATASTRKAHLTRRQTTTYQNLWIPEALTGPTFNLTVKASSRSFWSGAKTTTYGYNGHDFWGPTLIWNQGDTVHINVTNALSEQTTVHWHGIHLPAVMDGGPHQMIVAGKTWSPYFTVTNNAATFWYHPHLHEATQKQLTLGAGGFIIIKDKTEAALQLPRTYGTDDIPVVFTSRRFLSNDQFEYDGDNVKYGDYLLANGVMNAQVSLPAQYVRLRILNAEIERGYNLGFSDNRTFYVIATDGGLVNKPIPITRMKLMPGERVEILVNLGANKVGSTVDLMAYNANQPFGFPGGEPQTSGSNGSLLNNRNFPMLHIKVAAKTAKAITSLPAALTTNHFWTLANATNKRTLKITGGDPGSGTNFSFDNASFSMTKVNQTIKVGAIEAWTIVNNQVFGHAFHIHDTQFTILSRSSGVQPYEQGWKDTLYVPRDESVTFVAKFADYASTAWPYMYHCHMSNHEDDGLMGQFLVVSGTGNEPDGAGEITFRNQAEHPLTPELERLAAQQTGAIAPYFEAVDTTGRTVSLASLTNGRPLLLFFIERGCPCSRDASVFINQLQAQYGDVASIVGVINASPDAAKLWAQKVGIQFALLPDPSGTLIQAYGAARSVYTTLVAPGGRIARTYPGYNQQTLTDTAGNIAQINGIQARAVNFASAPAQLVAGCPFSFSP